MGEIIAWGLLIWPLVLIVLAPGWRSLAIAAALAIVWYGGWTVYLLTTKSYGSSVGPPPYIFGMLLLQFSPLLLAVMGVKATLLALVRRWIGRRRAIAAGQRPGLWRPPTTTR